MKRIYCIIVMMVGVVVAFAQTPKEILERMSDVWEEHEKEGVVMTVDTKVPVIGTISMKDYSLGKKTCGESKTMGLYVITWDDGVTTWTYGYSSKIKKLTVKDSEIDPSSSENNDSELFSDITDGYDISIKEETADSWLFLCKKQKSNPDKDSPKTMEVRVAKNTYYPMSLKAKMSGISLFMHDISFGVKEEYVTFNIDDYPGVEIEDKRGEKK